MEHLREEEKKELSEHELGSLFNEFVQGLLKEHRILASTMALISFSTYVDSLVQCNALEDIHSRLDHNVDWAKKHIETLKQLKSNLESSPTPQPSDS